MSSLKRPGGFLPGRFGAVWLGEDVRCRMGAQTDGIFDVFPAVICLCFKPLIKKSGSFDAQVVDASEQDVNLTIAVPLRSSKPAIVIFPRLLSLFTA